MSTYQKSCCMVGCALVALMSGAVLGEGVTIVVQEGDMPAGGGTIEQVNVPIVTTSGEVAFVGEFTGGGNDKFIWRGKGVIFRETDEMSISLSGGEASMGVSDTPGEFIYSPSIGGQDGVYSHNGMIVRDTDAAPGAAGEFIIFASRPYMLPDGTAMWVSGLGSSIGGSTQFRALYVSPDADLASTSIMFRNGDMIDGLAIADQGVQFSYDMSDNGKHHIHLLLMDTGNPDTDAHIYLDGSLILQEGDPNGSGVDNWKNWSLLVVNNDGNYVMSGDTDGDTNTDEFIGYNGVIEVREGDVLDGVTLGPAADVRALGMNNSGRVAHLWRPTGTTSPEILFVGSGSDLLSSSSEIIRQGDNIDVDGDSVDDFTIVDINNAGTGGSGLAYADRNFIHLDVDLEPVGGGTEFEAMLRVLIPPFGDLNGSGCVDQSDLGILLAGFAVDNGGDIDGDNDTDQSDLGVLLGNFNVGCR